MVIINNKSIDDISKSNCTGCSACAVVCPKQAIKIIENESGFIQPEIDYSLCVNCGQCRLICPICNLNNTNNNKIGATYSAWSNDKEIINKSSSGGIFFEIAKYIIQNDGIVGGVILRNNRAVHVLTSDLKIVKKMRGSKYIQSNPFEVYKKILDLDNSKKILFVGTPCQVAGLKNLLSFFKKNSSHIITCDLICHGVPSYNIFDNYMDFLSNRGKISNINFRDKKYGWENFSIGIKYNNGSKIYSRFKKDIFMQTYLSDIALRYSCYDCKFNRIPKQCDITLGDFWAAPRNIINKDGTSAILLNSEKGRQLINNISKLNQITLKKVTLHEIAMGNKRIISIKNNIPAIRNQFLEKIKKEPIKKLYKNIVLPYIKKEKRGLLLKRLKRKFYNLNRSKKSKTDITTIGIYLCEDTLNYGEMLLGETVIYNLKRKLDNVNFILLSDKIEETIFRFVAATDINEIEVYKKPRIKNKFFIIKVMKYLVFYIKAFLFPSSTEIAKRFKECDYIIVLGGDEISEYYGIFGLINILTEIYILSNIHKVFLLSQTIGPFNSWRKIFAKITLKEPESIYLRDKISFQHCTTDLRLKQKCYLSTDLGFLNLAKQNYKFNIKRYGIESGKYICFIPSGLWSHYCNDYNTFVKGLIIVCNKLLEIARRDDLKIVLLPHVVNRGDPALIQKIINKINSKRLVPILDISYPYEARLILGEGLLTISGRMHGTISSLQKGIPAISMSYSVKYAGVIGYGLNLHELVVEIKKKTFLDDINEVCKTIENTLKNYDEIKKKVDKSVKVAKKNAMDPIINICDIISLENI